MRSCQCVCGAGATVVGFGAPYGAGVLVVGPAHAGFQNCVFENNTAEYGPAIALHTAVNKASLAWLSNTRAGPDKNEVTNKSAAGTAIAIVQKPATVWSDKAEEHQVFTKPGNLVILPGALLEARLRPEFVVHQRSKFDAIARVCSPLLPSFRSCSSMAQAYLDYIINICTIAMQCTFDSR